MIGSPCIETCSSTGIAGEGIFMHRMFQLINNENIAMAGDMPFEGGALVSPAFPSLTQEQAQSKVPLANVGSFLCQALNRMLFTQCLI